MGLRDLGIVHPRIDLIDYNTQKDTLPKAKRLRLDNEGENGLFFQAGLLRLYDNHPCYFRVDAAVVIEGARLGECVAKGRINKLTLGRA